MCSPATCNTCHKTTWAGCGQHVDAVMRNVPKERQCTCERNRPQALTGESVFKRLFGG